MLRKLSISQIFLSDYILSHNFYEFCCIVYSQGIIVIDRINYANI